MNKNDKKIDSYFNNYFNIILHLKKQKNKINQIKKVLLNVKKSQKILVFGNGGSSAIASHFALDVSNVLKKKCINLSDSALITCFSNDFGFENWIDRAIKTYANKGDILFLISSSGTSRNMINAIKKNKRIFKKIITLTGNCKTALVGLSNINIQINSNTYNIIENSHQIALLSIVDLIKENKIKK